MQDPKPTLILASQSVYRQSLLQRLGVSFKAIPANVDETPLQKESVEDMVLRLGLAKAAVLAKQYPDSWVIASDQSAECEGIKLGKSGGFEQAIRQLQLMQGKCIVFHTSLILHTPRSVYHHVDQTTVYFRHLSDRQLKAYLDIEQPYDCAGSFKAEGLGVALFDRIESHDPTALVGLPLIKLANWLTDAGVLLNNPPD